jgi:acyl-CoA thioester hydrolase
MTYQHQIRVYYEDTDAGGVVYYANYLKFAERARTELLRAHHIEQTALINEHDLAFVVRHAEINIIRPARLDDLLTITTLIRDIKGACITMHQTITRNNETLAEIAVQLATIGKNFVPKRVPDWVSNTLKPQP